MVGGICLLLAMRPSLCVFAEDRSMPTALKDSVPLQRLIYSPPDDSFSRLWDVLVLVEKANSGNPHAQHELGLRYLMGKNFSADTAKAAYWIGKAAKQNLVSARYNIGILVNNGWGIPWNPFEAYKHFRYAADQGMKEAQYVYGLMLTDNLVVARNYRQAQEWITLSADAGYPPAMDALAEFKKRGINATPETQMERDTAQANPASTPGPSASGLTPDDADVSSGSLNGADDQTLLREALIERGQNDRKEGGDSEGDIAPEKDAAATVSMIQTAAKAGSPEALVLLGRWHETGRGLKKDDVLASVCYLRALRNQSPWAPMLIWNLIRKNDYFDQLKTGIRSEDPAAKFAWADLVAYGFDRQLTEAQVFSFLEDAAVKRFDEAAVELGLMYFSGKWVLQDREKGKSILKQAADSGNREAQVRLWMIGLDAGAGAGSASLVDSLRRASNEGSVFAQAMLGYCYRRGIGVVRNPAWSVSFYRKASQRGNKAASIALREMYDEIRPKDPEFQIVE